MGDDDSPIKKKFKASISVDHICNPDFTNVFQRHWLKFSTLESPNIEIRIYPYRICRISNFIRSKEFMKGLKNELAMLPGEREHIDLYSKEETEDLHNEPTEYIQQLHRVLANDLRRWINANAGMGVSSISMASSYYCNSDYYLCHDDYTQSRKMAYILYLSEDWTKEDGGSLDFFNVDSYKCPTAVVCSLTPEYNSLVLFEIIRTSYYQIREIVSPDKNCWTIHGWFHNEGNQRLRPPRPPIKYTYHAPQLTNDELDFWVSDCYLSENISMAIRADLKEKLHSRLTKFIKWDVYNDLSAELTSADIKWSDVGPADRRYYEVADEKTLLPSLAKVYRTLKSLHFFRLMKRYSGMELVPDRYVMRPKCVIELQRWTRGCYTLVTEPTDVDVNYKYSSKAHRKRKQEKREASLRMAKRLNLLEVSNTDDSGGDIPGDARQMSRTNGSCSEDSGDERIKVADGRQREREENPTATSRHFRDIRKGVSRDADPTDADISEFTDSSCDLSKADDNSKSGVLDVIMQFHTADEGIEFIQYVDPADQGNAIIHLPAEDNNLQIVSRTPVMARLQKYVNHQYEGYFYNLICTYYEAV